MSSPVLVFDNQGLSHYSSYLALGLSKYHDIVLYGFSYNDYVITGAKKEKKIEYYSLEKILPKGSSVLKIIVRSLFLFLVLFKELNIRNYEIVHIQERLPMFFLLIPLLKLRRKKIFWTIHDVDLLPLSKGIRGKIEVFYRNAVSQPCLLAKYADAIIVHAQSLKEVLVSKKIDQSKIHVVRHFDYKYLLEFNDNNDTIKRTDDIKIHEYVLFFGDITPWKGIETLIDAAKIVREKIGEKFNLVIAGKSYDRYINTIDIINKDCKFVKLIDKFIPTSEIPSLVSKSSFLVLPYNKSFQYSVSGVIPLAYTFSKPVIASSVRSIVEYVDHNQTGFIFESGDSIQLANYMLELIKNKNKCIEMGRNANHKLLYEMSLELCCKTISDLYNRY
jgi:glycosyltransferase involved in cell wall biosynthesis